MKQNINTRFTYDINTNKLIQVNFPEFVAVLTNKKRNEYTITATEDFLIFKPKDKAIIRIDENGVMYKLNLKGKNINFTYDGLLYNIKSEDGKMDISFSFKIVFNDFISFMFINNKNQHSLYRIINNLDVNEDKQEYRFNISEKIDSNKEINKTYIYTLYDNDFIKTKTIFNTLNGDGKLKYIYKYAKNDKKMLVEQFPVKEGE